MSQFHRRLHTYSSTVSLRSLLRTCACLLPSLALATPQTFDIPAESTANALLKFSQQAHAEVLFSFDDLRSTQSGAILGQMEPADALGRLLRGSGFGARRTAEGKYIVTRLVTLTGSIKGRLLLPDGSPARNVRVSIADTSYTATTEANGEFDFDAIPQGNYRLFIVAQSYRPLEIVDVRVDARRAVNVETHTLQPAEDLVRLAPQVVEGKFYRHWKVRDTDDFQAQRAAGNLDLPRSEDDALPYTVYDRDQISRSGVINLNDFLLRNVIDGNAAVRPADQDGTGTKPLFVTGSTSATLRGYGADETIVLVNGRRLPEILVAGGTGQDRTPPDVNFIPLNLVERVEVLPVSASALYSGNPVGGVINIVLRPNVTTTEVTTTYTNALGGFDAPQSTLSLQHGQSLLGGKLQLRVNATITKAAPVTETELGYIQRRVTPAGVPTGPVYGATPNVRSTENQPLLPGGSAAYASVAPGANGSGGLSAFNGRIGTTNVDLFDLPSGFANTPLSRDYLYGRRITTSNYFGSASYDVFPWLQLGLDGMFSRSIATRGQDIFQGNLHLDAASPLNPFGQPVEVSLLESAPLLGQNYGEARVDFSSLVLGALVRLPAEWRVSMDAQYGHSVTTFRGVATVDRDRWQKLVDDGLYNPLRDTQQFGPPQAFYDHALVFYGARDRFITVGDYETIDAAVRVTNQSLSLPTGSGAVNVGADYRMNRLGKYTDARHTGAGELIEEPTSWAGRTIERISAFTELQAPLLPANWLPKFIREIETDLAARYVVSDTAQETNLAPTGGLKVDFAGGFSLRGTVATSNRLPSPFLSRKINGPAGDVGSGEVTRTSIYDPRLNETYTVEASDALNPNLRPESAVTRTLGALYQHGKIHRVRLAIDFADTRKSGELTRLEPQAVVNLEELFPARITRDNSSGGSLGRITALRTGNVNLAWRHSQNWSTAVDYAWTECFGGRLDLYGRWVYFQKYELQIAPDTPTVDELENPDGTTFGLLRHRANFGASWSNRNYGFGLDGHYFHSRAVPFQEWPTQHNRQVNPYWQFDAFVQTDLARWLPWKSSRFGLRGQLRVNNLLDARPPRYANDPSGAGVQSFSDWRRQTYAASLQATF